jgi:hypothetical protein
LPDLRNVKPVLETHLVGLDEAQALIHHATLVRGVKHEAVETFRASPRNEALHQKRGEPATSPIWLGEHIDDDGVPALSDGNHTSRFADRMRKSAPQLDADAGHWTLRQYVMVVFGAIGLGLLPWTLWLSSSLKPHHATEHWDVAWAGYTCRCRAAAGFDGSRYYHTRDLPPASRAAVLDVPVDE